MTLQPLPSEFPDIWENFWIVFYQWRVLMKLPSGNFARRTVFRNKMKNWFLMKVWQNSVPFSFHPNELMVNWFGLWNIISVEDFYYCIDGAKNIYSNTNCNLRNLLLLSISYRKVLLISPISWFPSEKCFQKRIKNKNKNSNFVIKFWWLKTYSCSRTTRMEPGATWPPPPPPSPGRAPGSSSSQTYSPWASCSTLMRYR